MASRLDLNFSVAFEAPIWNLVAFTSGDKLLVEVRDDRKRKVSFALLDLRQNCEVYRNRYSAESWWVNALAASRNVVLLQQFDGANNPDKKRILAVRADDFGALWVSEDLNFQAVKDGYVLGSLLTQSVCLDLNTGQEVNPLPIFSEKDEILDVKRPFQYREGTSYFETVQAFVLIKMGHHSITGVEYLEHAGMIFISYYTRQDDLVNYLMVVDSSGELQLHEKLDERQKGLGMDTFFILRECLIYIRNRTELISYRIK